LDELGAWISVASTIVHLDNIGPLNARVRHEIQLDDARPLDVVILSFVGLWLLVEQCWCFDAGDDEIPKLSTLAIKWTCQRMPVSTKAKGTITRSDSPLLIE
jgi:hypothetical protein